MGKSIGAIVETKGKWAMILGTILCIIVGIFFYLISVVLLHQTIFFIIAMIMLVIAYIDNMIKAYKDMKKLQETEDKTSNIEIHTYNDFKK